MEKYNWSKLNHLQLGRYAEYYVKMEFTMAGLDVYSSEVDDKGIDFLIKKDDKYYDIQVKSVRSNNYIFFQKDKFELRDNLMAAIVIFLQDRLPNIYLIPSTTWLTPDKIFVSRDYIGKKSKPEWGFQPSLKNISLMKKYLFSNTVKKL